MIESPTYYVHLFRVGYWHYDLKWAYSHSVLDSLCHESWMLELIAEWLQPIRNTTAPPLPDSFTPNIPRMCHLTPAWLVSGNRMRDQHWKEYNTSFQHCLLLRWRTGEDFWGNDLWSSARPSWDWPLCRGHNRYVPRLIRTLLMPNIVREKIIQASWSGTNSPRKGRLGPASVIALCMDPEDKWPHKVLGSSIRFV